MKSILIDAGPIIALFNGKDLYHQRIIEFLRGYTGKLITTWPVMTEVGHMLDFSVDAQIAFLNCFLGVGRERWSRVVRYFGRETQPDHRNN